MIVSGRAILLGQPHKRAPRRMPRQRDPRGVEREYAKRIIGYVHLARRALQPLIDRVPALAATAELDRRDAGEGDEIQRMADEARRAVAEAMERERIDQLAREFARRTETDQRIQMSRQVRAAVGVDVLASDAKLRPLTEGFVAENVALIRSIPGATVDQVEQTILRGVTSGTPSATIAAEIEQRFAVSRDRARLIARDQVGKFYGQVNKARQEEMGVTRYTWRTSNDNRVRAEHRVREGQVFKWSDPPSDGHPGQPIQCRCVADPDFTSLFENVDAGVPPVAPPEVKPEAPPKSLPRGKVYLRDVVPGDTLWLRGYPHRIVTVSSGEGTVTIEGLLTDHPDKKRIGELLKHTGAPDEILRYNKRALTVPKTPPKPRVPKAPVMKKNLGALSDAILAPKQPYPVPPEAAAIRRELNVVAGRSGALNSDVLAPNRDALYVRPQRPGVAATHGWDGRIEMGPEAWERTQAFSRDVAAGRDYAKEATAIRKKFRADPTSVTRAEQAAYSEMEARVNGFETLLHEALHGHSPLHGAAYIGEGAVVEEVTTEVVARSLMREQIGVKPGVFNTLSRPEPQRFWSPYGTTIADVNSYLSIVLGVSPDVAYAELEAAALRFKQLPASSVQTAADAVDALAGAVDYEKHKVADPDAASKAFADALRSMRMP